MKSNLAAGLLVIVGLTIHVGCRTVKPLNYPTGAIELKYYATGPWAVSESKGNACCDSSGNKFDLYYPTNLGANGFRHAILTWGNGTFGKPSNVDYFLNHMASWGFAVVATEDSETGLGQTILDGVNFMIKANSDPKCIFYNKLDVNERSIRASPPGWQVCQSNANRLPITKAKMGWSRRRGAIDLFFHCRLYRIVKNSRK